VLIQFQDLTLTLFGTFYGILTAYVLSKFGVATQELIDQYIYYPPTKLRLLTHDRRENFFWRLHAVTDHPRIFFYHYERIRKLCSAFAGEFHWMEYLDVMRRRPEKLSTGTKFYVLSLIGFGVVIPPLVSVAYYYWLPNAFPWFGSIPYDVSPGRSLFELVEASLVFTLPLVGYAAAVAKLEAIIDGPTTYSQISRFLNAIIVVWTGSWMVSLALEWAKASLLFYLIPAAFAIVISVAMSLPFVVRPSSKLHRPAS
jgi:hypothetical protein